MGIRCYAYPLAAEFVDHAQREPHLFVSADPLADAWGPEETRPTMLYLDKSWRWLQRLTSGDATPRSSHRLVQGNVTYVEEGMAWHPWLRVIAPDEVAAIAADLALLGPQDVQAMLRQELRRFDSGAAFVQEEAYIVHFLHAAQRFVSDMSRTGMGVITMIG
ncbi:MAG: DUF1877 family protein [Propionibacteriaceae bacterium]